MATGSDFQAERCIREVERRSVRVDNALRDLKKRIAALRQGMDDFWTAVNNVSVPPRAVVTGTLIGCDLQPIADGGTVTLTVGGFTFLPIPTSGGSYSMDLSIVGNVDVMYNPPASGPLARFKTTTRPSDSHSIAVQGQTTAIPSFNPLPGDDFACFQGCHYPLKKVGLSVTDSYFGITTNLDYFAADWRTTVTADFPGAVLNNGTVCPPVNGIPIAYTLSATPVVAGGGYFFATTKGECPGICCPDPTIPFFNILFSYNGTPTIDCGTFRYTCGGDPHLVPGVTYTITER